MTSIQTKNPQPRNLLLAILGGLFLLIFIAPPTYAQTETPSSITLNADVGLDGYCISDKWLPVRVTLENNGTNQEGFVEVNVNDGVNNWHFSEQISLPAVSRKEVTIYVYVYGSPSNLSVAFINEAGAVVKEIPRSLNCLSGGTTLIGVWAASPSVYNVLTTLSFSGTRASTTVMELANLPTHPKGLDMLSLLIISDVDTGALTDLQREALASWVANGGRLIVAGGGSWQKTAAGLADLIPISLSGTTTVNDVNGLLAVAPGEDLLEGSTVLATGTPRETAEIVSAQDDVPLIIRQTTGFGDVIFFAFDPALAPLRNWTGLEAMYQSLLANQIDVPTWANGYSGWTEASSAVSNVPGLGLPSIFLICGFLGLYTLALGPINYLVLRKLKRRELAWITIPTLVVVFSCSAFVMGTFVRGTRSVINNLAIVQVWPDRPQARVHGLVGVFSPNRKLYDVEINGNYLAHPLINFGLGNVGDWQFVHNTDQTIVSDLRIDAGGIEGLVVEGDVPAPAFASDVSLQFGGAVVYVQGEITNQSDITLRDTVLLAPGQSQQMGDFAPGSTLTILLNLSNTSTSSPNSSTGGYTYYGYNYDNTMQDVFGTSYPSSSFDQDLSRRYNLLQAAMGYSGTRGSGVYLIGWTDTSPLDVTLGGKGFKSEHTSLYILALNPKIESTSSSLTLPPAMFTWYRLENNNTLDFAPYNTSLYQGVYQIRYKLSHPVAYHSVQALTFHLTNYTNTGPHYLNLALWDFALKDWVPMEMTDWGDFEVPDPARFVGTGGDIRLKIENPNQISTDLERADFTLVVEK